VLSYGLRHVTFLIDRWFMGRGRAEDLRDLRRRFAEPLDVGADGSALRLSAQDLRRLRERLSAAFGRIEACSHCVRPRSDEWPGGHCCSGTTATLFTDDEITALKLSGTKIADLRVPRSEQSGCAFRGRAGCSLQPAHRPCLCVRYTCRDLESELTRRGDRAAISGLQQELRIAFENLCRELSRARQGGKF
jgi:hypothetical protein